MCESPKDEEFSLGVTQLLDDLLGKENEEKNPKPEEEEAMRRTFQRTQEFCDEAQKYMDLVAQEEADARREADQKRKRAERRWGFAETADSNVFNGSSESFFDAIQENEKRLAEVHQDLVDIMETKGRQVPVKTSPASPMGQTIDFHGSLGCTFTEDDEDASPILDFERLLAHCEKMQAELEQWGERTPRGPRGWRLKDCPDR